MNRKHVSKVGKYIGMACLLFVCATVQSCRDEYFYDNREPDFLGSSIYDYLKEQGNFELFLRVIDDLNYGEVLRKTGSKTLFVADDDAFRQGIWNEWKIEDYEQLTKAHKRVILYSAMLDNAYLLEMLSKMQSTGANAEPVSGKCIRRETSAEVIDTIGLFTYASLPKNNPDWDIFNPESEKFRYANVRLALDATRPLVLHLNREYLYQNGITEGDLRVLVGNPAASWSDIYVFDKRVLKDKSDVTCKNGYVHQLDGLLIPPSNMAEELRKNADETMLESGELDCDVLANSDSTTMLFSRILDRFAVPVPIGAGNKISEDYHRNYVAEGVTEQLYEKRYYTEGSERGSTAASYLAYVDVEKELHNAQGSLLFDPGWNAFKGSSDTKTKEVDMAAIFAPSDKAIVSYFRNEGSGKTLIDRYGALVDDRFGSGLLQAIDSIPVDVIEKLVRNHMQMSFVSAVPSKFELVVNDARDDMGVEEKDVCHTMLTNNGVVYVMDKLYAPAYYESVVGPVMLDDTLSIFYKFIEDFDYDKYLLSMQNQFSLITTLDTCMWYYSPQTDVDNKEEREAYRFEASKDKNGNLVVEAKVYKYKNSPYDASTNTYVIDWKKSPSTRPLSGTNIVKEILEYNIVLGDMNSKEDCESGKKYYMAKGYGTVMVKRGEDGYGKVTAIAGGRERQKERDTWIPVGEDDAVKMKNGHTFKLQTSMIQPPVQSVYDVLSTTPEYANFFDLCNSVNDEVLQVALDNKYQREYAKWKQEAALAEKEKREKPKEPAKPTSKDVEKYHVFSSATHPLVRMFDTYHYTVYVPENDELNNAINNEGLPTWGSLTEMLEAIKNESDAEKKKELTNSLEEGVAVLTKFIRYHFQDNSVYVDLPRHALETDGQEPEYEVDYATSALNDTTNRFTTVLVKSEVHDGRQTIAVRGDFDDEEFNVCYVVNSDPLKENQLYNVMARDIQFNSKTTWDIQTSSYAVIHQIDGCLKYGGKDGIYDSETKQFRIMDK